MLLAQNGRCHGACASDGAALCHECFHVDPDAAEPAHVAACVDFTEKRRPPVLHEIESLTPRNVRRICVVREEGIRLGDREASREAARMLAVGDAERLMGFPEGWTESCAHASRPNTPEHDDERESDGDRDTSDDDAPDVDDTPSPEPEAKATNATPMDVDADVSEGADEDALVAHDAPLGDHEEPPAGRGGDVEGVAPAEGSERGRSSGGASAGGVDTPTERGETPAPTHARERSAPESEGEADESGEEDLHHLITPQEATDIVRVLLVASATAVPQSRWIGEQLADPYGAKFQRQTLGVRFNKEVLGGLDDSEGRAWPEAGWNVHPRGGRDGEEAWTGRHALRDCSDTPAHLSFTPLGAFLKGRGATPSADAAAAYVTALQIAHTDIAGFVMDALDPYGEASAGTTAHWGGDKPHATDLIPLEDLADLASAEPSIVPAAALKAEPGATEAEAAKEKEAKPDAKPDAEDAEAPLEEPALSGAEDKDNRDDPLLAGEPVWAPWKLGKGVEQVLWPGIALHRDKHKDVIPSAALKIKVKGATSDSHRLVVFFGDRTYQWLPATSLHDFRGDPVKFEERMSQCVKRHSSTFRRACEEARVWSRTWRRARFQEESRKRKRREQRRIREAAAAVAAANPDPEAAVNTPEVKSEHELHADIRSPFPVPLAPGTTYAPDIAPESAGPSLFGVDTFGPGGYAGSLASSAEPEPCGACRVCRARTPQAIHAAAVAAAKAGGKASSHAVGRHLKCPQVSAVRVARKGHTGALLALRRGGAVGERVRVLWDDDDRFYRGRVCRFDPDAYTHDVEYDDGDLVVGLRLWNESVQLVHPDADPHPRGRRFGDGAADPALASAAKPGAGSGTKRKSKDGAPSTAAAALAAAAAGSGSGASKKRKSADAAAAEAALAGAQRCDACARSHKGIAYCVARGHTVGSGGKGGCGGASPSAEKPVATRADGAPRVAARRGGNGKFVVADGVAAALASAGVEVPERCALCIRRKKGIAHCLKKGHIEAGPQVASILANTIGSSKPSKATKEAREAKEHAAAANRADADANAAAQAAAKNFAAMAAQFAPPPPPVGMSAQDAAAAQAAAAAAMAAAMMGMGAMPVPMMPPAPQ